MTASQTIIKVQKKALGSYVKLTAHVMAQAMTALKQLPVMVLGLRLYFIIPKHAMKRLIGPSLVPQLQQIRFVGRLGLGMVLVVVLEPVIITPTE